MNWFKRYGIVGGYFLCAILGWYIFLSGSNYKDTFKSLIDKFQVGGLVGIATFLFLPAGYLIMVISQWLYYRFGLSLTARSIHLEIKNKLSDQLKRIVEDYLNKLGFGNKKDKEEAIESVLTYIARRWFNLPSQEQMRSLNEYNQKRFDIIAMNNGIAWATIFAFFIALIFRLYVCKINLFALFPLPIIFFVILIIIFIFSLRRANWTLENQILIIETQKFQEVENNMRGNRQ
jgi:ABC-type multidrug transport system fused ATPase/permease subunit